MTVQPFAKLHKDQKVRIQRNTNGIFEGIKSVSHTSSQIKQKASRKDTVFQPFQPSQQEPNLEKRLFQKDLWLCLLSNEFNPLEIHEGSQSSWENCFNRTIVSLDWKGYIMKSGSQSHRIFLSGRSIRKLLSWKRNIFMKKEQWLSGRNPDLKDVAKCHGGLFSDPKT